MTRRAVHHGRMSPRVCRALILVGTAAWCLAIAACSSGPGDEDAPVFDDAADLHAALEAIPAFHCGTYVDLEQDVAPTFEQQAARFEGLTGVGICFGRDSMMVYLFETPEARREFTDGQDWPDAATFGDRQPQALTGRTKPGKVRQPSLPDRCRNVRDHPRRR